MNDSQYPALRTELQTDPAAIGYAPLPTAGEEPDVRRAAAERIAGLLSAKRTGETTDRELVDSWELFGCVDSAEWSSLAPVQREAFRTVLSCPKVNLSNPRVRAFLSGIFGAGATRTAIAALQRQTTTRAVTLGFGRVEPWDVSRSLGV